MIFIVFLANLIMDDNKDIKQRRSALEELSSNCSQGPSASNSNASTPDPTKMSTKERIRRLQAICKEGASPLSIFLSGSGESNEKRRKQARRVQHIDTPNGKRFACATKGGINDCLTKWMREGTRVTIKVRAFAPNCSNHEPNRLLQGAIVAFDKHWNMVLRDVDEVYVPSLKLGKVQSMPGAMPASICYTRDKTKPGRPILARHLKCSFITGSSIVLIHNET